MKARGTMPDVVSAVARRPPPGREGAVSELTVCSPMGPCQQAQKWHSHDRLGADGVTSG